MQGAYGEHVRRSRARARQAPNDTSRFIVPRNSILIEELDEATRVRHVFAREPHDRHAVKGELSLSVLFVGIYLIWWRDLLGIFIKAGTPDAAQVVSTAGNYIVWIILIPLASAMPFIMDGIMVGATETKVMRNSMLLSTVAYFGIFYSLYPVIGNNALWLAFTLYMFLRGTLQLLMTRRLRLIYRKAAA